MSSKHGHGILSRLAFAGGLSLLAACGADYELDLQPLIPQNQSPFADLDALDLVLEQADGSNIRHSLDSTTGSPNVSDLGLLNGTRLRLDGMKNNQVVMTGRTAGLNLDSGSAAHNIFVSEVNQMAWLEDHEHGLFGTSLVSTEEGRFYAFGGIDLKSLNNEGKKGKKIFELDLGNPLNPLVFEEVGEMPAYLGGSETATSEVTARHGASATLLTHGPHTGKILVAGGSPRLLQSENITASAFLYDPQSGALESLGAGQEMDTGHYLHQAVRDATGNVVVLGGWEPTDPGFIAMNNRFDFFDASTGQFDQKITDRTLLGAGMSGMAAPLGTAGVVHCGGAVIRSGSEWESRDECTLITTSGTISDEIPPMPAPLSHGSMIALSSSELLVVGGVSTPSGQPVGELSPAEDAVFYYDHLSQAWQALDGLQLARADAGLGLLPDGRVAIIGGRQQAHLFDYSANSEGEVLACVEIYDPNVALNQPAKSASILQNGCTSSQETSDLPNRLHSMATAQDSEHGLLVVGGINADGSTPAVLHWRFAPTN